MIITVALALLQSCISIGPQVPWQQDLHTLAIQLVYPSGHASGIRAGVEVSVENYGTGAKYIFSTDNSGNVETKLPNGIYRISVSDKVGSNIFNGSIDKMLLSGEDKKISLKLEYSEAGVISEVVVWLLKKETTSPTNILLFIIILLNGNISTIFVSELWLLIIQALLR